MVGTSSRRVHCRLWRWADIPQLSISNGRCLRSWQQSRRDSPDPSTACSARQGWGQGAVQGVARRRCCRQARQRFESGLPTPAGSMHWTLWADLARAQDLAIKRYRRAAPSGFLSDPAACWGGPGRPHRRLQVLVIIDIARGSHPRGQRGRRFGHRQGATAAAHAEEPRASMRACSYHASPGACQASALCISLWMLYENTLVSHHRAVDERGCGKVDNH